MEATFTAIYRMNWWETGSGTGSLSETTEPYRRLVEDFVLANGIRTVLDIGCGDWQFSRFIDWGSAAYIGIDVVREIVESNQRQYGCERVTFVHGDVLQCRLPDAELVLLKDVLQHWTIATIRKFLPRLQRYPKVLITNSTVASCGSARPYADLPVDGQFRPIDVRLPPFVIPCHQIAIYSAQHRPDAETDVKTVLLWLPSIERQPHPLA